MGKTVDETHLLHPAILSFNFFIHGLGAACPLPSPFCQCLDNSASNLVVRLSLSHCAALTATLTSPTFRILGPPLCLGYG